MNLKKVLKKFFDNVIIYLSWSNYFFFTNNKAPITIGINHNNSWISGISSKITNDRIKTNTGMIGKLDIATKESSLDNATTHNDFAINKIKNQIKNIHKKFCFITSKSHIGTNT